ncbi:MAG: hypothetical protein H6590_06630 [Flavobacteriales bacterium]|nr:hypothetical protein [Flavobacteriales bacterium]
MTTEFAPAAKQRPTLLTILCILSFIFGAFGLYSGFSTAFTDQPKQDYEEAKVEMEKQMAEVQGPGAEMAQKMMDQALAMAEKQVENATPLGISGLLLSAISLLGVWMMWNLRKTGFWLYLVATIAGLIVPIVFLGASLMTFLGVGFMGVIALIFIILYAVNLKHMS